MRYAIRIAGADGAVKAERSGDGEVRLVYRAEYADGDVIELSSDGEGYSVARLEDSIDAAFGLLAGGFRFAVPFGEKRARYSPKSFTGGVHLLWARDASTDEVAARRNLALNPLDCHGNTGFFPHAFANVETRGEAAFAASNAINGNATAGSHGDYPYESWGINRDPSAMMTVDFGRNVVVDTVGVCLRSDFPHDNWWKSAVIEFSDGSREKFAFEKRGDRQLFSIAPRECGWARFRDHEKDESNPSQYPALTQLEFYGTEADK
ncbi:MAG: carbohydrate-binding protein [Clostridiales bacterium]|jgi:hypothetical protein|nr:carbohydrate-binding protein [Clostridiales bacterium]